MDLETDSETMETKHCPTCNLDKAVDCFEFKDKQKQRRSSWCKSCTTEYKKKHYAKHRDTYLSASLIRNHQRRAERRQIVIEHLQSHPCVDCGENDPIVLEFDHRDPSTKINSISRLVSQFAPLDVLRTEIEKCDIRCANCHRRKTAKDGEFYLYMLDAEMEYAPRRPYRTSKS